MAWTYTTLVQAIKDYTQSTETTFDDNIDNFILSTEDRILYSVDLVDFRKNVTGATTASYKYIPVPTDFMAPFSLNLTSGSSTTFLLNKDVEYLQEYNPTGATGIPKYYALFDVNNFLLAPIPTAAYDVELHYYYRPTSITQAASGTSWLGLYAVDAMLYGCLVEAYTFLKGEPDLLKQYSDRFMEAISRLKNYGEGREDVDAYRNGLIRVKAN